MPQVNRRGALGALGAAGAAAAGLLWWQNSGNGGHPDANASAPSPSSPPPAPAGPGGAGAPPAKRPAPPADPQRIAAENAKNGSTAWKTGRGGALRTGDDATHQIKGYTSTTSVGTGERLDFHVAVAPAAEFTVTVYRFGDYAGAGARRMAASPRLQGAPGAPPVLDAATGMLTCDWPVSWTLDVPADWTSGAYLAVFDDEHGTRNYTVFAVRDDHRSSDFLVVLPFSTYQAYNQYPLDGRTGKSLYYGYDQDGKNAYRERARRVSFDRPYMSDGMPTRFDLDQSAITWMEESKYDVTYASSLDLEEGRVEPSWYRAMVFSGHDEYWSDRMRKVVEDAQRDGVGQAWLTANNMYWHVRYEQSTRGVANRAMTCWKDDADPGASERSAPTDMWRRIRRPEQEFLGVQYNGIVAAATPLVVAQSGHWAWAGTGVRDGDTIRAVVGGEADGVESGVPTPQGVTQVLLSSTPYTLRSGARQVQSTSLYERPDGTLTFCAATFNWALALHHPKYKDERIQQATKNILDRMRRA